MKQVKKLIGVLSVTAFLTFTSPIVYAQTGGGDNTTMTADDDDNDDGDEGKWGLAGLLGLLGLLGLKRR
ncbi:MAG TPA: WGxxGxxG family protein, partial [Flavisolibacter sp.]|nr:WGxxGxxG family protein [Flavisolibacter sp.]